MSQDSQVLDLLTPGKLEKPKLKKQPKPEIENHEISPPPPTESNHDIISELQKQLHELKEQINKKPEPKPKKERTEAQRRAFEKARAQAHHNAQLRHKEAMEYAEKATKEYEKKVIDKAISIKKREIKQNAKLEAIPDDKTPLEDIKKISQQKPQPKIENSLDRFKFF